MDKTVIDVLSTPLPVIHLLHIIQMLCVTTVWIAARLAYCQKAEHTQFAKQFVKYVIYFFEVKYFTMILFLQTTDR